MESGFGIDFGLNIAKKTVSAMQGLSKGSDNIATNLVSSKKEAELLNKGLDDIVKNFDLINERAENFKKQGIKASAAQIRAAAMLEARNIRAQGLTKPMSSSALSMHSQKPMTEDLMNKKAEQVAAQMKSQRLGGKDAVQALKDQKESVDLTKKSLAVNEKLAGTYENINNTIEKYRGVLATVVNMYLAYRAIDAKGEFKM